MFFDYFTFNVFAITGASDYLPTADKWLLHIYYILFANTARERNVL